MSNETTNVDHKMKCTANMIITYPGKEGIVVLTKNGINIREILSQKDTLKLEVTKKSERDIEAHLAKYHPEKLKEYEEAKKSKDKGR